MPRFGGHASMLRLPLAASAAGLDACFVGVPFDIGTSNRAGARFGPRQIRAESCLIRPYNMATRAAPFDSLQVADIGDVAINTFNLDASMLIIEQAYRDILEHNCKPLTLGGITMGGLIGNAFIVENLFSIDGLGRKVIQSLFQRDIPVVLSGVMMITFVFIVTTTVVDLMYGVLDPRIRHARKLI